VHWQLQFALALAAGARLQSLTVSATRASRHTCAGSVALHRAAAALMQKEELAPVVRQEVNSRERQAETFTGSASTVKQVPFGPVRGSCGGSGVSSAPHLSATLTAAQAATEAFATELFRAPQASADDRMAPTMQELATSDTLSQLEGTTSAHSVAFVQLLRHLASSIATQLVWQRRHVPLA